MTLDFTRSTIKPSNRTKQAEAMNTALDKVWLLINKQQAKAAINACTLFTQEYPDNADGWYANSFLTFQLKNYQQALLHIDKSLVLEPETAQWHLHKAHTLLMLGEQNHAQIIIDELIKKDYNDVDFCAELALVLNKMSDFRQAVQYYQQAISLIPLVENDPDYSVKNQQKSQLYYNLASIYRYLGDLEQANDNLNLVINLNPSDHEAYLLRSTLKKQTVENNHIEELQQCLAQKIKHPIGKAQICYALAKEQEDLQNYRESFKALALGATTRRENMRYEVKHDVATIAQIIATFDSSVLTEEHSSQKINAQACNNHEAIFVLGLPRTGSTLVERIISNHSDVFNAGELNNFALQMMAQVKSYLQENTLALPQSKAALVALTRQLDFAKLGQAYIDSTRPDTGHSAHFVDKLPLNSLYVGLIHLALPHAKIIHVKRHPLDTCYAIYKQLFTNGYPFSYNLKELGQYYIAHHRLMAHWQKLLPDIIHQIAYEDVVDDIEQQAKSLLNYCQLDWQEQCINFQQNKAPSTTASASQVRQGLYKSSKGKWRHFSQQLAPLKAQLEHAGICCD
jgi:tetratricopeptide (TPR) repeat protein